MSLDDWIYLINNHLRLFKRTHRAADYPQVEWIRQTNTDVSLSTRTLALAIKNDVNNDKSVAATSNTLGLLKDYMKKCLNWLVALSLSATVCVADGLDPTFNGLAKELHCNNSSRMYRDEDNCFQNQMLLVVISGLSSRTTNKDNLL